MTTEDSRVPEAVADDGSLRNDTANLVFTCELCAFQERYDYFGATPPFSKHITFLEDCFVIRDPFTPKDKHQVLVIGSQCAVCAKRVCHSPECSFYHGQRYCRLCALNHITSFPKPVQIKLTKIYDQLQMY